MCHHKGNAKLVGTGSCQFLSQSQAVVSTVCPQNTKYIQKILYSSLCNATAGPPENFYMGAELRSFCCATASYTWFKSECFSLTGADNLPLSSSFQHHFHNFQYSTYYCKQICYVKSYLTTIVFHICSPMATKTSQNFICIMLPLNGQSHANTISHKPVKGIFFTQFWSQMYLGSQMF